MDESVSAQVIQLATLFERGPVAVLTGAGISTDSGIPDYRGAGSPPRTPMNITEFLGDLSYRRRFWAGARIGADRRVGVQPNAGHRALVQLETAGRISGVITQNVDDLHGKAGTRSLIELHGNGGVIRCVDCGRCRARESVLAQFDELNPGYAARHTDAEIAPDGDAIVTDHDEVRVPVCPVCGGILRPDVIYFGEFVPPATFTAAADIVEHSRALIIAGSSLAVNTGVRLLHRAERLSLPVAVINRGPTAADGRASLRLEAGTSEVLTALAETLAA